jgi:hypothetical protein
MHDAPRDAAAVTPRGGLVVIYAALMLAILLAALDQTIVATALLGEPADEHLISR